MVTISELLTELAEKMNPTREIEDIQTLSDCYMAIGNVIQGRPEGNEMSFDTGTISTSPENSSSYYENDGYGWLKFSYLSSGYDFSIIYNINELSGIATVTNGTDIQSGVDDTILYADTNVIIFTAYGIPHLLGKRADGSILSMVLTNDFKVESSRGITVTDNLTGVMTDYSFPEPMYCYIPDSNGLVGYFPSGTEIIIDSTYPNVFMGYFGGVTAYDNISDSGHELSFDITIYDSPKKTDGAVWSLPREEDEDEDDDNDDGGNGGGMVPVVPYA